MKKYLRTKKCKICKKIGKVYLYNNALAHRTYICDACESAYAESKHKQYSTK